MAFDPLLVEIVREAERVVDHQVKAAEESDDKSEHLIGLGVALVGAEVAAFAYVQKVATLQGVDRIVFPAAMTLALAALVAFLDAYVGLLRRVHLRSGPHPEWIAAKANEPEWPPNRHLVVTAAAYARYYNANSALLKAAGRSRRIGLLLLIISTAVASGGALYLLA